MDAVLYEKEQIGKILTFIGGSRDTDAPTLFQIANVDSGEIRWIHSKKLPRWLVNIRQNKKASSFYEQIQQQKQ